MRNNPSLFSLLLLLAVSFVLYRLFLRRAAKSNARNQGMHLPITVKNLYRLALGTYIRRLLFTLLPIAALLAAACIAGRMGALSALVSFALVAAFFLLASLPRIRSQYAPIAQLRGRPDFDEVFSGKQLYWLNGAWGYADDEWFIRAGNTHSVVLRAAEIDFSQPVRKQVFNWQTPSFRGSSGEIISICRLHFTGRDGQVLTACTWADANILNWIKKHGGSMD